MKSNEIKTKFIELGKLIEKTGLVYSETLRTRDDIDKSEKEISDLETLGDGIQEELETHFKSNDSTPYLAIDRVKLLHELDNILDHSLIASKTFSAFSSALPSSSFDSLTEMAEIVKIITQKLAKAIEVVHTSFKDALVIATEIENIRDQGLNISFNIEHTAFEQGDSTLGWKEFISISTITKKTMSIISEVKKAAEIIIIMSIKYV